jgi:cytochrome bd-type quinol oxidase subunit 1
MASNLEHDAVFNELARCPQCGSLNDADAKWCGQCLADFEPEPETPSGSDTNVLGQRSMDPEPMLAPEVSSGLFGVEKGKAVWRCSRCFTRNAIETNACSECGLPYIESAKREAGAFSERLSQDSARTTVGIVGWSARIMMVVGGLLAPVVLFWTALAGAVALVLRKALGRDR